MLLTVEEFVARIGGTEADNIAGSGPRGARVLDQAKIEGALAFAAQIIVAKIGARYPEVPEASAEMVRGFAVDIALYRLRYKTGDQSGVSEETWRRYQAAIKELEKIGSGATILPGSGATGSGTTAQVPMPVLSSGEPARAPSILEGYR